MNILTMGNQETKWWSWFGCWLLKLLTISELVSSKKSSDMSNVSYVLGKYYYHVVHRFISSSNFCYGVWPCALLFWSCSTLCNSMDCSLIGSSLHGILQARTLEWVAMPSSRGSSWPRDWTCISWVSCISRWTQMECDFNLLYFCRWGNWGT